VRLVTTLQDKHSHREGCLLFAVHAFSDEMKDVQDEEVLKKYFILHNFQDVFPAEILELALNTNI